MQKAFCYFTMQRTNVSSIKNHKSKIPVIYFFKIKLCNMY
ncbi:Uncharacterised protein [Anaerotruncus colihominis]|uniref:Uncharacterized protein n=1 Tax=Anaerotruncus colihominis TaxID=169435 RepID=A0A174NVV9_9FIRM|nr:Uncharacterised protein [Anaerotruncus colihominis]